MVAGLEGVLIKAIFQVRSEVTSFADMESVFLSEVSEGSNYVFLRVLKPFDL